MRGARRAWMWLAVVGAVVGCLVTLAGPAAPSGALRDRIEVRTGHDDAVLPTRAVRPGAELAERREPVRPILLWWVAAVAAMLLAAAGRPALAETTVGPAPRDRRTTRFDRGPPLGLSTP